MTNNITVLVIAHRQCSLGAFHGTTSNKLFGIQTITVSINTSNGFAIDTIFDHGFFAIIKNSVLIFCTPS